MSLKQLVGGALFGAVVLKFVPPPILVLGVLAVLGYFVARVVIWLVRVTIEKLSEFEWPECGCSTTKDRIAALEAELTKAQMRAEAEMRRVMEMADARIAELTGELQNATAALEV